MRIWLALLVMGCGDGSGDGGTLPDGSAKPECKPCADGLQTETAPCGPQLDSCTNRIQDTAAHVACFQQDARCYSDALDRSSTCHEGCGDQEQANVERCTGGCFTDRGNCAEAALWSTDRCLDPCVDQFCADLCRAQGQRDFDACDRTLVDCSEACKARHRSS